LKNTDGQRYNSFTSGQGFHASAWCDVVPRHPTFVIDNDAFSGAIRRRTQIPEPYIYNGSDIVIDNHENSKLVLDVVIANAAKAPYNRIKNKERKLKRQLSIR
jgi:hypothetical protein